MSKKEKRKIDTAKQHTLLREKKSPKQREEIIFGIELKLS